MFERFTERARKVIVLAQDEAERLRHEYIGTEHLLLGLLHEEAGVAAQALSAAGVAPDGARGQVEGIVGYGEEAMGAQAPLTSRSKKVIQLAEREATQLGDDHVGSEHVMLGLLRESEGVAAQVLSHLDVDPDSVRREVIRRLPDGRAESDPFDEVEREMEEEEGRRLFRGRVAGIRAELDLSRTLPVAVDADYAYLTPSDPADTSETVGPGEVAGLLRAGLEETETRSLEPIITALGERLLGAFPAMREVSVTVSGVSDPENIDAPTFSVSATFER